MPELIEVDWDADASVSGQTFNGGDFVHHDGGIFHVVSCRKIGGTRYRSALQRVEQPTAEQHAAAEQNFRRGLGLPPT